MDGIDSPEGAQKADEFIKKYGLEKHIRLGPEAQKALKKGGVKREKRIRIISRPLPKAVEQPAEEDDEISKIIKGAQARTEMGKRTKRKFFGIKKEIRAAIQANLKDKDK